MELVGNGQDTPMILSLISGDLKFEYNTEREYISDGVGSSFVDIASDSSWKCSSSFEQFWTFPHFNDSHWNMSTILSKSLTIYFTFCQCFFPDLYKHTTDNI